MADFVSDTTWHSPNKEMEDSTTFDMSSLRTNLPQNRKGLSRYYSGKSRSFSCMAGVECVEDLKKQQLIPDAKRKKYSERQRQGLIFPPFSCRRISSSNQCATPCIGA
uniref:Uncharacterized protein n=1 Tax=Nelumbo nucifera TaxID=4432 RepID=A0A822ZCR9_NELNU|nr:TPA_asm: hypothetical protein HUJ06_015129 [Nelumbo nucifera]